MLEKFPNGIRKVLLVNPPDADESLFQIETAKRGRYTNYPPYGLLILATKLREIGVEPKLINLNDLMLKDVQEGKPVGSWRGHLDDAIFEFKPDLICVTCMFTLSHQSLKQVCDFISLFDYPVAIGGVHVSNDAERVLDDVKADFAFLREGDRAIQVFCDIANGKRDRSEIGQVIFNFAEESMSDDEIQKWRDIERAQNPGTSGVVHVKAPLPRPKA